MSHLLLRIQAWLYCLSFGLGALVAWHQYAALCPSNSNPCFRSMVANVAVLIACAGFLTLYLWKFMSERAKQQRPGGAALSSRSLPVLRLFGFVLVCAALGWLVGGGAAGFA